MTFSIDAIGLGVPESPAAHGFYTATFSPTVTDHGLDLHGTGEVELSGVATLAADAGADPATSGFRGYLLSYVVSQPSEVEALLAGAVQNGAEVLKAAKKGFFGGFSAVYRAPDGAIWKLAAPGKKDTGPVEKPPVPTETIVILGVADPAESKVFYEALGTPVDRDYGNKFVDFRLTAGKPRLALMQRKALAKDAGVDSEGSGFQALILHHRAESPEEVDDLLAAAVAAGGRVTVAAAKTEQGYCGHFTDPDGFRWKVSSV